MVKVVIADDLDNQTIRINAHGKVEAVGLADLLTRLERLEGLLEGDKIPLNKVEGFVVGKVGKEGVSSHADQIRTPGMYSTVSFSTTSLANGFPTDGGIAEIVVTANAQIAYYSTYRDDTGRVQQAPAVFIRTFLQDSQTWKPWVRVS